MRIRVSHETTYRYDTPARGAIQIMRLTPRSHDAQHVIRWNTDVSEDCLLTRFDDAFGNVAHCFTIDRPITQLRISVHGEVETTDTHGVIAGTLERFPSSLFLRETDLTQPSPELTALAHDVARPHGNDTLRALHDLQAAISSAFTFDAEATEPSTSAAEAFARKRGVCQDYAHVFIAAARHLGVPARYVGGHLWRSDGNNEQPAGHAWTEACVPDLGWVGFDPTNGVCTTDAYVRIAVGLDYQGAAPIRGTVYGRARESMSVKVRVQAGMQGQN